MHRWLAAGFMLTAACGEDGTAPEYESIAGDYIAAMTGPSLGFEVTGVFTLTLTQDHGALGGTYTFAGTAGDGIQTIDFEGSGAVGGTIEAGENPAIGITLTPTDCPGQQATFSGDYAGTGRRLMLEGPVEIFLPDCDAVLDLPMTLVFNRR